MSSAEVEELLATNEQLAKVDVSCDVEVRGSH